jgi:hypothetical protein
VHPAFPAPSEFQMRFMALNSRGVRGEIAEVWVHYANCHREERTRRSNPAIFFGVSAGWIASLTLPMTASSGAHSIHASPGVATG